MKYSLSFATFTLFTATSVLAAPTSTPADHDVHTAETPAVASAPAPAEHQSGGDEYVVIFDADQPVPPEVEDVLQSLNLSSDSTDVRYTFSNSAFKGFAASMKSHCLDTLDAMAEVKYVEKAVAISSLNTRTSSPWGLQRISSTQEVAGNIKDTTFTYTFEGAESDLGKGVDIYVVDTGVNTEHVVFGGRAQQGFSFDSANTADEDGHGTHVAGTAAGSYFGVASGANVFAVKVLGADGSGSSTDTIAGMNWVIQHNDERKTQPGYVGAVMSMSWGLSGISNAVQEAVKLATDNGIHVSVAAGNSAADSCSVSPASSGGNNGPVVTVGSIGISDAISTFSNNGACNDVYAPGEQVLSAWPNANNMVNFLSGTSMACPHVTGVMATLMTQNSSLAQNPAAMKNFLRSEGIQNALANPSGGKAVSTSDPKILVQNEVVGGNARVKRDIRLIQERAPGPISSAMDWVSSLYDKVTKRDELTFVVKRDGHKVRF